jgi:two-component system nitrate/nitrite response regulator NarL
MEPATVFMADSDRLLREGLKVVLPKELFSIVGAADSLVHVLAWFESGGAPVSLIICDPADDVEREFAAAAAITRVHRGSKIVVLTRRLKDAWFDEALRCGVGGFLSKDAPPEALVPSLQVILLGGHVFTPQRATHKSNFVPPSLVSASANDEADPLPPPVAARLRGSMEKLREIAEDPATALSAREGEILNCLVAGMSNKMIARELCIAEATVKVHLKALLRKVNANNRTQAAVWAISRKATAQSPAAPAEKSGSPILAAPAFSTHGGNGEEQSPWKGRLVTAQQSASDASNR